LNFKHRAVSLEDIDFEDHTFCLSFPCRAMNLLSSLDLVGIIHPPVVREGERYQIVCGRGRLEAAKELGFQEITCKVLPRWMDDLTCLMISFEENITTRGFNLVEKALVVEKFQNYLPDEEIIRNILPRLGFSPSYKNFEFLQRIGFLEEEAKGMLLDGCLNPRVAVRLLEYPENDRRKVLELFRHLRPSSSRQREILELLEDVSRREERSLSSILEDREIREILSDEKLNPPQKTEKFYSLLKRKFMPHLQALEEEFRQLAQRFSVLGARVKPSPSFEKEAFSLELEFKDLDELRQKISSLLHRLEKEGSAN